jgi:hypothetical protein
MSDEPTLENSPWARAVSRYLVISVRMGGYSANMFLLRILNFHIDTAVASPFLRSLVYLTYSVMVSLAAALIVKALYTPGFINESEARRCGGNPAGVMVLNETDYEYKLAAEKLIYESLLFYFYNFAVAFLVGSTSGWPDDVAFCVLMGFMGAMVSAFNFFAVVVLAGLGSLPSSKRTPVGLFMLTAMIPLVLYVGYAMWYGFSGQG